MSLLVGFSTNNVFATSVFAAAMEDAYTSMAVIAVAIDVSVSSKGSTASSHAVMTTVPVTANVTKQTVASGMSRKFWEEYYTKAWAKPVFAESEIVIPQKWVKKPVVAMAEASAVISKANIFERADIDAKASAFVSKLFEENARDALAQSYLNDFIELESQQLVEEEELMLMAMVL